MNTPFCINDPEIYTFTWLPIGKSNMEALNRFIGSHKRYATPTEFGVPGQVNNMSSGSFKMDGKGVYLTPADYISTEFLHARISEKFQDSQTYGMSIYKNGLAGLGIKSKGSFSTNEIKVLSGKLAYKITDCIFPILNDQQQTLISTLLCSENLKAAHHKVQSYSLIVTKRAGFTESTSSEIFKNHTNEIEALTDWVISHSTINSCHIFIGMAATLCIGEPDELTMLGLRYIQFLQSCNKISHHMHALLWSSRKQIHLFRTSIIKGNYKVLKSNNEKICQLNSSLLRLKVSDEFLRNETLEMKNLWNDFQWADSRFHSEILAHYQDEVDKSEDRNITINQLGEELSVLGDELENRLELIMTRDSMTLNIILLVLTVVSVLGVGEVVGFSSQQWKIVAVVLLPFSIASFIYLRNFLKNFLKRL